jgi:hypothetical protein
MELENKTVEELKQMCKKKKIKGYSKFNKKGLINLLKNHKKVKKGGGFDLTLINYNESRDPTIIDYSKNNKYFLANSAENKELLRNRHFYNNAMTGYNYQYLCTDGIRRTGQFIRSIHSDEADEYLIIRIR